MSRDPAWQAGMLAQSIEQRRQIAQMMRLQSQMTGANTPANIMDVNAAAVDQVLVGHDVLLHGHTHRPMLHMLTAGKQRMVLGDWREDSGEAIIASFIETSFEEEDNVFVGFPVFGDIPFGESCFELHRSIPP